MELVVRALGALLGVLVGGVATASPVAGLVPPPEPSTALFWWVEVLSAGLWILAVTILVYCIYDCRQPDEAADPAVAVERLPVDSRRTTARRPAWRLRVGWPR